MLWLIDLAEFGSACPTNTEIAVCAGMGQQRFQPWHRSKGIHTKKAEAGSVLIYALEQLGRVQVERGPNWRRIYLVKERLFLEPINRHRRLGR